VIPVTDGAIALINLESARRRAWERFSRDPNREGIAEGLFEQEQLTAQFLGDAGSIDRLETMASQLDEADPGSGRTALIHAQFSSLTHRFEEAREHLSEAARRGAPPEAVNRLALSIDQARGTRLEQVLEGRRRLAAASGRLDNLVPLAALLADLREFTEADALYRRALREYREVSPFAVSWACFQLGVLWGELVPDRQPNRAAQWYRRAISYLPCYVKARVHLAEILSSAGQVPDAEALLVPAVASGDPEVRWRLADALTADGRLVEAEAHLEAARSGFERLLERHLLAFADHGAEFYSGSGNDARKALDLARINVANRPTLRALEQAYAIAAGAGEAAAAEQIRWDATNRWGRTQAFQLSPLARGESA